MATLIKVIVNSIGLLGLNTERMLAQRQSENESNERGKAAEKGKKEKEERLRKEGRDENGELLSGPEDKSKKGRREEPIGPRNKQSSYYWLVIRSWWFGLDTWGLDPRPGISGPADIAQIQKITLSGAGSPVSYETIGTGGDSILNLLNNRDSSDDTYRANFFDPGNPLLPYLPPDTSPPVDPYVIEGTGPRKTLEDAEPGFSEFDPEKYTVLLNRQLPIRVPFTTTFSFANVFFNIYQETIESTKISLASQSKKIETSGKLTNIRPRIHGQILDANDSNLSDVNHAYLVGKFETGSITVKPRNTRIEIHVFVTDGFDRSGLYSLASSGTSHFTVGSIVYWQNYSLFQLEPDVYRKATITSINRGTFTYDTDDDGGTATHTGLRIVLDLTTNPVGTLPLDSYQSLSNSSIIATFESVEEALESEDTVWFNTYRDLGGFQNEWVTKTINGQTIPPPEPKAKYIGESYIETVNVDCSKDGKAYLMAGVTILKDSPIWREQVNYHTNYPPLEDIVVQRPALTSLGLDPYNRQLNIKFIELDCKSNTVLRTFENTVNFLANATVFPDVIARAMPEWFPSKRYRLAGYTGDLNLNKLEDTASRVSTKYDPETGETSYYVKSWPLNQSLSIEEIIDMITAEENAKEEELDSESFDARDEIEINESGEYTGPGGGSASLGDSAPSRWGYTYTQGFFVSS